MTEPLTELQTECRRLIALFDRECRQAGFVVEEKRTDDNVMADVVKGQKGHPVTVEQLIRGYVLTAKKDRASTVSRLFAAVPELLEREIGIRQLVVDPLVKSVIDSVPLSPFDAQRWFLEATYAEHGKSMRLIFTNEHCRKAVEQKFEQALYQVAKRRGFQDIRFEVR